MQDGADNQFEANLQSYRMGCRDIAVVPLSEEEALILFLNKVGPNMVQNKTLMPTLRLVVKDCACLPLTVVVVAGTLTGEDDPRVWKIALKELKDRIGMVEGVEAEVMERLKFSFDHLKDENVRHCFLYCALYPEDFGIGKDMLIECWIDEGFIVEMDTRQDMKDKGHVILKKLVDNCFRENAMNQYGEPCVKMHDAMRDMALSITSTNPRYMIQAGMQLSKLPKEEEWRADVEKVSLMMNYISEIPEDISPPNCQLLTTLLPQGNRIDKIPNAFFANMPRLSVLNLSWTTIKSLLDSISELKNLTSLLLHGCISLRRVPCLSKLQGLKKLDLNETEIEEVPEGMDMLIDLRYLDLVDTHIQDIPAGLLFKLSRLRHLKLGNTNASIEEVMTLEKLEWFEGKFQDTHEFSKFVTMQQSKKNLIKYRVQVGSEFEMNDSDRADKSVIVVGYKLCEGELIIPFDVQDLEISDSHHLRSLNGDIPSLENAIHLRVCSITDCREMECVVSLSLSSSFTHPFQSLEELYLYDLPKLREVIEVERFGSATTSILTPSASFSLLKVFNIWGCSNMKTLLPHWLLPNLHNLEDIYVDSCNQLIEILGVPTSEDEEKGSDASITFSLPKLSELRLHSLRELESICCKNGGNRWSGMFQTLKMSFNLISSTLIIETE